MIKIKDEKYEVLFDLYINKNMTYKEIAEIYSCSDSRVKEVLKSKNIVKAKEQISNSRRKTCLKKYGTENVMQNKDIHSKAEKTNIERYGYASSLSNDEIKTKIEKTFINKYGVKRPLQSKKIVDKLIKTNNEKYGGNAPINDVSIKAKIRQTNLDKYGVENVMQNKDIRDKMTESIRSKYNIDNPFQLLTKNVELNEKLNAYTHEELLEYFKENYYMNTYQELSDKLGLSKTRVIYIVNKYNLRDVLDINDHTSSGEADIVHYLESIGVTNIERNNRTILAGYELDIYLPDNKIAIEFNGTYWHSDACKDKYYHINKSKDCEKLGIRLIHIYEYEWEDELQREKIKSLLRIACGKTPNKIYARECEIREISNAEARPFNDANHLQGHRNAEVTYGLFYENNLVQLMSFGMNRYHGWEIIRGCPGSNNIVVGGVSRLFKYFIKNYDPETVFSYCDFNKFDGHGYEALGMQFAGYSGPDLAWILDNKVIKRNPRKHSELKEKAICRIWGSGSKKYLWKKEC